jgi:hypothetical protein
VGPQPDRSRDGPVAGTAQEQLEHLGVTPIPLRSLHGGHFPRSHRHTADSGIAACHRCRKPCCSNNAARGQSGNFARGGIYPAGGECWCRRFRAEPPPPYRCGCGRWRGVAADGLVSISDEQPHRVWRAPLTRSENRSPRLSQYQATRFTLVQLKVTVGRTRGRFGLSAGYQSHSLELRHFNSHNISRGKCGTRTSHLSARGCAWVRGPSLDLSMRNGRTKTLDVARQFHFSR